MYIFRSLHYSLRRTDYTVKGKIITGSIVNLKLQLFSVWICNADDIT
jgi:hypothetical protein